jgi:hypothetical protein
VKDRTIYRISSILPSPSRRFSRPWTWESLNLTCRRINPLWTDPQDCSNTCPQAVFSLWECVSRLSRKNYSTPRLDAYFCNIWNSEIWSFVYLWNETHNESSTKVQKRDATSVTDKPLCLVIKYSIRYNSQRKILLSTHQHRNPNVVCLVRTTNIKLDMSRYKKQPLFAGVVYCRTNLTPLRQS